MSALAFFRNPTSDIGVLCDHTFEPLTLHGTRVTATIRHGAPIVTVSYEYLNRTAASQKVFAAFAVPQGWRLLSARADASMGNNFVRTLPPTASRTGVAADSKLATLQVPWGIMVGQYVVVQATFLAPPAGSSFTLPQSLFPKKVAPAASAAGWRGAFAIQAPFKLKEGCSITIEGSASLPLEAIPEVNKGTIKATGTLLGDPKGYRISFELPTVDDNIVIRFPFKAGAQAELQMQVATVIESNREVVDVDEAFAVVTTLYPTFTQAHLNDPNAEFVFVIGLGNGASATDVQNIRSALHATVAGLPPSCNINAVCCTGSERNNDIWLSEEGSVPISDELLSPFGAATAFLSKIATYAHSETRNGQVIRSAMKRPAALVQEIISGRPYVRGLARNIVLVTTDGGDTQAAATSQMVTANRHSTSVSAVALEWFGASDVAFLQNLADISNGELVRCQKPEATIEALLGLVSRLAVPALTEIALHYTDSRAPTADGSSAPTVTHCGVPLREVPFIRAGSEPQWLYAYAHASSGQLTVRVEGLIGPESMQYLIKTPKEAIASSEQSTAAKANALSLSAAHLTAAAFRQDQLIRSDNKTQDLQRLTNQFGVPTYKSVFGVVDESNVTSEGMAAVSVANPLTNYVLGRKAALAPEHQSAAVTVVSSGSRPYGNVATDKELQSRLIQYGEAERQALQKKAQDAFEARKRKEKAIGIDDQSAADSFYEGEQLQIDSIRNPAAEYLGGQISLSGGSSGPQAISTSDYFRSIVLSLIGAICEPLSVERVLQAQQADGSLSAQSATTLAALGVTREVLSHIPTAVANKPNAADLWVTIIGLARCQHDPRSILFQRKARTYLATSGVEPDQHEPHVQHVLADSK